MEGTLPFEKHCFRNHREQIPMNPLTERIESSYVSFLSESLCQHEQNSQLKQASGTRTFTIRSNTKSQGRQLQVESAHHQARPSHPSYLLFSVCHGVPHNRKNLAKRKSISSHVFLFFSRYIFSGSLTADFPLLKVPLLK